MKSKTMVKKSILARERIRVFDWSKTDLGPIDEWSLSLKNSVNLILESPVAIVILWGSKGTMVFNDAYATFAGTDCLSKLGSDVADGWPEIIEFNNNVIDRCMNGESMSYKDQMLTLNRNGASEQIWMDLNYSPITDDDGQYGGTLAIVIETTPHELPDDTEETVARQVIDVIESVGDAVFMLDKDWLITRVNKVHEKVSHTKRRDTLGKLFWDVFPMGHDSKYWIEYHKVMLTRKASHFEEFYQPLNLWTEADAYPTRDGGIAVFFRDITARRKSEEALREQLQITETITNNATACLFMIDNEGIVTFLNPAASRTTGYTAEDAIGRPMHSLVHHSHPDGTPYPGSECPLVQTYRHGKSNSLHEDIFFRKDGTPFPAMIIGMPVAGEEGQLSTIVEFRDITEEKRALEEQQQLISMTNQRNELVKLNNAKDEFIALASHQLRTPATAVKQYVSLVLDEFAGPLEDSQRMYLRTAYASNERQLKIIDDLLKTAQIDSNRFVLHKKRVVVAALVQSAIDDMTSAMELKKQRIVYHNNDSQDKVQLDENEMKLVFMNLLENASKYSYPDTVVTINIRRDNTYLEIEICDEGVGISNENIPKIFQKFTRINNDLSDTVTGSGLGLYWVKKIIKLHGGSLKVESTLGKGSKFKVRLPL